MGALQLQPTTVIINKSQVPTLKVIKKIIEEYPIRLVFIVMFFQKSADVRGSNFKNISVNELFSLPLEIPFPHSANQLCVLHLFTFA